MNGVIWGPHIGDGPIKKCYYEKHLEKGSVCLWGDMISVQMGGRVLPWWA
jgi:hypothetical protein